MAVKSYTQSFFLEGPYADDVRGSTAVNQEAIMSGMTAKRGGQYDGPLDLGSLPRYEESVNGKSYGIMIISGKPPTETYMNPITDATVDYLFQINNMKAKEAERERLLWHPRRHAVVPHSHEAEHGSEHGESLEQKLGTERPKEWGDPRALVMHVDC